MSTQKTCLSTVFECLANFLNTKSYMISAGIHLEGGTLKKYVTEQSLRKTAALINLNDNKTFKSGC